MSDTSKLHAIGEEIVRFAEGRSLQLGAEGIGELRAAGWDVSVVGAGCLCGSRYDQQTQSYAFITEAEYAGPPLHLACLVREFDIGKLAGQLRDFQLLETSSSHTLAEYVSNLPWPFQPRWVRALMRFGVAKPTGAIVVLGQSVDGGTVPPGATLGTVHYSLYHIRPAATDPGRSIMRRIINVDMRVALPAMLLRCSLASHYQCDVRLVEQELAAWEGSALQRRLQEGECYRDMERALEPLQEACGGEERA